MDEDEKKKLTREQQSQLKAQIMCYRLLSKNQNIPEPIYKSATKLSQAPVEDPQKKLAAPIENHQKKLAAPIENPRKKLVAPIENPQKKLAAPIENPQKKLAAPVENPQKKLKSEQVKVEKCLLQLRHNDESIDHASLSRDLIKDLENLRSETSTPVSSDTLLQELFEIGILELSPLKTFPPSLNGNIYISILKLGLQLGRATVKLLLDLMVARDAPIDHSVILKLSFVLSLFVKNTHEKNNALTMLQSLVMKTNGLTNDGLDMSSDFGFCENSRQLRLTKTLLAGVSEEMLKRCCIKSLQHTLDNMDLRISNAENHLTVSYVEVEQVDTSELCTEGKTFEEKLALFHPDEILLTSVNNGNLKVHFEDVVTVVVGRILGLALPEFKWLLKVLPEHHQHSNSETSAMRSQIHTLKPLYLQETKNKDMVDIVVSQQSHFLGIVAEHCGYKEKFKQCLAKAKVVATPCDRQAAKEADQFIRQTIKKFGEFVAHGDLLTRERWDVAHRLRRNSATAEERLEHASNFFLGMFHAEMAKTIQDIVALMPELVNIEDTLSLGWFRCLLGLSSISNDPNVIKSCGNYEKHSQFINVIGKECMIEAFRTLGDSVRPINCDSSFSDIKAFIFGIFSKAGIKLYFDPKEEENEYFDDVLSNCQNLASRTVISVVMDAFEHEGDSTGLRAGRKLLIPYMLNRKENIQDSKYALWLTRDEVDFSAASERTKKRLNLLACANPSGGKGNSMHRDKLNEIIVRQCKESLKGMHSSLDDLLVEKTILSMNVSNQIVDHNRQSMLLPVTGGGSSQKYFSNEEILEIRREFQKFEPFKTDREKKFYKSKQKSSVYTGLTMANVLRFLERNKNNYAKHCAHK